ncbi:MAG: hypothetical protein QOJ19_4562, partial [Acidimicrobiia bacterium]|nr:hypothetical protein [Acidimicrobiia bacterium]
HPGCPFETPPLLGLEGVTPARFARSAQGPQLGAVVPQRQLFLREMFAWSGLRNEPQTLLAQVEQSGLEVAPAIEAPVWDVCIGEPRPGRVDPEEAATGQMNHLVLVVPKSERHHDCARRVGFEHIGEEIGHRLHLHRAAILLFENIKPVRGGPDRLESGSVLGPADRRRIYTRSAQPTGPVPVGRGGPWRAAGSEHGRHHRSRMASQQSAGAQDGIVEVGRDDQERGAHTRRPTRSGLARYRLTFAG